MLNIGNHLEGKKRISTEIEKIVLNPNTGQAKDTLPNIAQLSLKESQLGGVWVVAWIGRRPAGSQRAAIDFPTSQQGQGRQNLECFLDNILREFCSQGTPQVLNAHSRRFVQRKIGRQVNASGLVLVSNHRRFLHAANI